MLAVEAKAWVGLWKPSVGVWGPDAVVLGEGCGGCCLCSCALGRLAWRRVRLRVRLFCLCLFLVFGCALNSIQTHSSQNEAQFG